MQTTGTQEYWSTFFICFFKTLTRRIALLLRIWPWYTAFQCKSSRIWTGSILHEKINFTLSYACFTTRNQEVAIRMMWRIVNFLRLVKGAIKGNSRSRWSLERSKRRKWEMKISNCFWTSRRNMKLKWETNRWVSHWIWYCELTLLWFVHLYN